MIFIKKNLNVLIRFTVLCSILLLLPAAIRPHTFKKKGEVELLINKLQNDKPDIVFIGNSMTNTRIAPILFYKLTNLKCMLICRGGVMSSVWYLILKNVVAASGMKPKAVFISFRDTELTEPLYRTNGRYRSDILNFCSDKEPIIDIILSKNKNYYEMLNEIVGDIYPIELKYSHESYVSEIIFKIINYFSNNNKLKTDQINNLLDLKNFRPVSMDGENKTKEQINCNFHQMLKDSFLPYIIDIAQKNNLNLIFIRDQKRPTPFGPPQQTPELRQYIEDLSKYISHYNYRFYDFTGNPRITSYMYGAGDHIDEKYKKKYTRIFVETVRDGLQ